MSYILDALKKVEHEKARKARVTSQNTITGELFSDAKPYKAARKPNNVIIICIAVVITFAATWFVLKGSNKPAGQTAQKQAPAAIVAAPKEMPAPAQPAAAPTVSQPVAALPPQSAPIASVSQPITPPAAAQAAKTKQKKSVTTTAVDRKQHNTPKQPEQVAKAALVPAPADIQVSGVAWQEDRKLRRAVVNGLLLQEGAVILGAKITEILSDRVRFTRSGTTFEAMFVQASGK